NKNKAKPQSKNKPIDYPPPPKHTKNTQTTKQKNKHKKYANTKITYLNPTTNSHTPFSFIINITKTFYEKK
ncbi:hypothetical protein, partial [Methanobrevibacter cuticularis]|uniref:hypothetical protein n=1 Tax=Methanobrevibacter cuticularis TaxID=47311 RepID=UPI0014714B53